jgi:penicillin-binding protein 2
MSRRRVKQNDKLAFEDSLNDDWSHDLSVTEVPLGNRPLRYLGAAIVVAILAVGGRIVYLNWANGAYYRARAADNIAQYTETPAPRGAIYDAQGDILAESNASFAAVLDVHAFIDAAPALASDTERVAESALGISPQDLAARVNAAGAQNFATPVVLSDNLTPNELVNLRAADLPTIAVENDFVREYPQGPLFSSVVGYTGRVTAADLKANPMFTGDDFIGKAGVEAFYDSTLRGTPGINVQYENAFGKVLTKEQQSTPQVGDSLHLTIDGGLQSYLSARLRSGGGGGGW